MKKKMILALGLSSALLLSGCSASGDSSKTEPSPPVAKSESPESSKTPTPTDSEKPLTLAEYNKIDAKFEIAGATSKYPYGVNYEYLTTPSQLEYFSTYSAKDIHEATEAGLKTYYNLRTEPEFMKTDRTVSKDAKVLDKYSSELGSLLKDAWSKEKDLFSYAPFYPFLNAGTFTYDSSSGKTIQEHLDSYKSYNVDTREVQRVSFKDASVSEQTMDQNGKPTLVLIFDEEAEYSLENSGVGTFTAEIKLLMQKDAKGVWQIQGMYWSGLDQTIKDSSGRDLPEK